MKSASEVDLLVERSREALARLLGSVPASTVRKPTLSWNDFDNYGKNNDPDTEWNNWVNWDQAPVPFDDSSDDS